MSIAQAAPGPSFSAGFRRRGKTSTPLSTKSLIHRDLKPSNTMLMPDPAMATGERLKVLDFGLAKLSEVREAHKALEALAEALPPPLAAKAPSRPGA